jgi:hypothetical protein
MLLLESVKLLLLANSVNTSLNHQILALVFALKLLITTNLFV